MVARNIINKIFLWIYIFYLVYTPVLASGTAYDKYYLLPFITLFMLIPYIFKRDDSVLRILLKKNIIILMLFIFCMSLYFVIVQILNGIDIKSFSDFRIIQNNIINLIIINIAILIDKLKNYGYSKKDALGILLKIGAIQGIICIISIFFEPLKNIAVYLYMNTGGTNEFVLASRIYGISSDYTYGMPIYHGILAGIGLYYGLKNNTNYFPYIVLILIASLMNGRTGILCFIIMLIPIILHSLKKGYFKMIFKSLSIFIVTLCLFVSSLKIYSPATFNFINILISDTNSLFFANELNGNYAALNDSVSFPKLGHVVFGAGHRVYGSLGRQFGVPSSDIGYINDIYAVGILASILFYIILLYFLIYKSTRDRLIMLAIFIALMFANIKGEIFRSSAVMFLVLFTKLALDYRYSKDLSDE